MKRQTNTAPQRGMPVEDVGGSSARVAVTGETVAFYYSNSGTRTVDAGQAIGVVVEAVLAYAPIASSSGDQVGVSENTSLSFTSTAFTTEIRLSHEDIERLDGVSFAQKLSLVQTFVANKKTADAGGVPTVMANGDYIVDYRHGVIIGKKASTQTTLTSAAYKVVTKGSTISQPTASNLNAQVVGNVASAATDSGNPVKTGYVYNATKPTVTDGQRVDAQGTNRGEGAVAEGYVDQFVDNTNAVAATVYKPLAVSTYCETKDISAALEASSIVKATPGVIYSSDGRIDSTLATGTYYILTMDSATLPSDGAVTMLWAPLKIQHTSGSDSFFSIIYGKNGVFGTAGIVICISTSEFTKTIGGAYLSMTNLYK